MDSSDDIECHGYALASSHGDLALYLALRSLRKVENGRAGLEMGVEDGRADTYETQVQWAANTIRHFERDATDPKLFPGTIRDRTTGFYTSAFLTYASHRYAPIRATNDPHNLNVNHATNWCKWYLTLATQTLAALSTLTTIGGA